MASSFTLDATIADPVRAVSDMALSLDRVATMLASSNTDLMECVVSTLDDATSTHRVAYAAWCAAMIAAEKMKEIAGVLDQAEIALLALGSERVAARARPEVQA
jgi:hypothetical protein